MESSNTINILNSMRGGTSSSTSGGQQFGHHQPQQRLDLPPGFRFHPTDEELVLHYLKNKVSSRPLPVPIIAEIDLYKYDPWDLPDRAICGENEWYFFTPRDRKYPNGARPNRAAGSGYWKATGTDKPISSSTTSISNQGGGGTFQQEQHQQHIKLGVKKALVFYKGRPPKGVKTNWIMHEYRLAPDPSSTKPPSFSTRRSLRLDDWVLCRIYKKMTQASRAHNGSESNSCVEEVLANLPDDHMQSDEVDASIHIYNHTRQLPRFGSLGKLIMGSMSDPFLDSVVTNQVSTLVNPLGAPNHTLNIEHLNGSQATWTNLATHIDSTNLSSSINSSNSLFPRVDGEQAHRRSTLPNNSLNVDQNMVLNIGLASIFSSMPHQHQEHHQQQANQCDDATTSGGQVSDNTNLRWPFSDTRPKFPYV